jgi:peptidyl-prolyl cis-trans isomerase C
MLATQAEANAVSGELLNGASFEDLARRRSVDPGSRNKGGDMGWHYPVHFDEPFAAALTSTQEPQLITTPVKTRFGWHVIRVLDIRKVEHPPFEKVRRTLEERLRKSREE